MVKTLLVMWETQVPSLGQEDPLEKEIGNPLQCFCLENPMDRGAWRAIVYRVTKSWTQLSDRACTHVPYNITMGKNLPYMPVEGICKA